MEVSKILTRSLRLAASTSRDCKCHAASISRNSMSLSIRQRRASHRPLSTSAHRRADAPADGRNSPPAPPPRTSTPKQELRSYMSSVQKVISGYNLKSRLPPRKHEALIVALTTAEVRVDAPGVQSDSLVSLLKTLRDQVQPILRDSLGSSDISQLLKDVSKQADTQAPPATSRKPTTQNSAPSKPTLQQTQSSIKTRLDAAIGISKPTPRPSSSTADAIFDEDSTGSTLDKLMEYYMSKSSSSSTVSSPFSSTSSSSTDTQRAVNLDVSARLAARDAEHLRSRRERDASSAARQTLRLTPALGRTVEITGAFDVTRALRSLEGLCARNNVKKDQIKQRFHVRRGQLKKITRKARWRKLFMEGFVAECAKVRRMRRQGW